MGPAAAPGGAPEAAVDRVGAGLGRHRQPALLEVGDRLLALDAEVADRGDDLEVGREHAERDVEADLVVAGAGGAVRDRLGADRAGRLDHRQRLLGPLGGHAQRVDLAPEHVALDQEADEPVVDLVAGVDLVVRDGADGLRLAADGGALLGRRAAGIDVDGVHRPAVLGEAGDAEGGIEAAGEGERERAPRRLHNA